MSYHTHEAVPQKTGRKERGQALLRAFRYLAIRGLVVCITVAIGVYAAIWVTNLGGYADEQRRFEIEFGVRFGLSSAAFYLALPPSEREATFQEAFDSALEEADLDQPFFVRSFRYFRDAITLTLGYTNITGAGPKREVTTVLEALLGKFPLTLLLFGVANILTFFGGLYIALILSRRYGSFLDRVATLLVPVFAAPPWFHGIFLIVIFASLLRVLPFGGLVGTPPPEATIGYLLGVLKHMILPVSAIVLGTLPSAIYANRALFLIHSSEDYVELAKAKGLRSSRLQRRYILRPVLPPIITNFAFISIMAWQGVILTEKVFSWPGLGSLLIEAIALHETPVVIGAVTMFAYLLGLTVFFLDLLYVIVDPRVSLGIRGSKAR